MRYQMAMSPRPMIVRSLLVATLWIASLSHSNAVSIQLPAPAVFSSDGSTVAFSDAVGRVSALDVESERIWEIANLGSPVLQLVPCPKDDQIVAVTDRAIFGLRVSQAKNWQIRLMPPGRRAVVSASCDVVAFFSPNERSVVVEPLKGGDVRPIEVPLGVSDACFAGSDGELAVLSTSGAVRILAWRLGKRRELGASHIDMIGIACLGSGGVLSVGVPTYLLGSKNRDPVVVRGITCDLNRYTCAQSPSGEILASLRGADGLIGTQLHVHYKGGVEIDSLPGRPISIAMSADARTLFVAFNDRRPLLLKMRNGRMWMPR